MRFLSLRQQLLFSPDSTGATSSQPLVRRHGKAVRAGTPVGLTARQKLDVAGQAGAAVGAPDIPDVDNLPQDSDRPRQIRSLFEVAGAGIMMALFLVVAIFA